MEPKNQESVVLKNKFYPSGLKEKQIYDYYLSIKNNLLNWIGKNNPVGFFLMMEDQSIIVKRKYKGSSIILTSKNYEQLITGRTLSVYKEHKSLTNYFVIDCDGGEGIKLKQIYNALNDILNLIKPLNIIKYEKLFTSFRGIHLVCYIQNNIQIDKLRLSVEKLLKQQDKYLVNKKGRHPNTINLDLSPNYKNSLHLCKYSLTKLGLKCLDISKPKTVNDLKI